MGAADRDPGDPPPGGQRALGFGVCAGVPRERHSAWRLDPRGAVADLLTPSRSGRSRRGRGFTGCLRDSRRSRHPARHDADLRRADSVPAVANPPGETGVPHSTSACGWRSAAAGHFVLDRDTRQCATSMVRVAGGETDVNLPGLDHLAPLRLGDYLIGRYEVTNRAFKRFVDAGGYQKRELWKHPFRSRGRELAWSEAMARFTDRTGRPGPAVWEAAAMPRGRRTIRSPGVSWYEAAAYAAFVGADLPTIYHWSRAAFTWGGAGIVPLSNFGGQGLAPVGKHQGRRPVRNRRHGGQRPRVVPERGRLGALHAGRWLERSDLLVQRRVRAGSVGSLADQRFQCGEVPRGRQPRRWHGGRSSARSATSRRSGRSRTRCSPCTAGCTTTTGLG